MRISPRATGTPKAWFHWPLAAGLSRENAVAHSMAWAKADY